MPNGGKPVLEDPRVRGLPLSEDGDQIWFFYHPIALRFGSGCPGDTAPARGECQFKAGRFTEAALEFRKALQGEYRRLAPLRLGDISLRTGRSGNRRGLVPHGRALRQLRTNGGGAAVRAGRQLPG
jgi:hypothetical protein